MNGVTNDEIKFLYEMAVLPVDPVLVTFPFVWIHKSVDVHAIIRLDPLHDLSLGASCLVMECIWNILGDESIETSEIKSRTCPNRSFKAVKFIILSTLNMYMTDCQKRLVGTGPRVNFKKPGHSNRLTDLFAEIGLTGILEGAAFDYVHVVFFSCYFR